MVTLAGCRCAIFLATAYMPFMGCPHPHARHEATHAPSCARRFTGELRHTVSYSRPGLARLRLIVCGRSSKRSPVRQRDNEGSDERRCRRLGCRWQLKVRTLVRIASWESLLDTVA